MLLPTHLAQVPDICQPGGNLRHALLDVLVISILVVLSGADDSVGMATFAERKLLVLRRRLRLANGPSSHDPFRRVFQKTLRGSGPRPLHLVSGVARAQGLCLAQVAGVGEGHELAALPDVLTLPDLLGGALVNRDALGYPPKVAAQIVAQGGDYLLALKQNQRGLRAEAKRALAGVAPGHDARAGRRATCPCAGR